MKQYATSFTPELSSSNHLFRNGLLRWQALTFAERFVCTAITLVPVWWFIGWSYCPLMLVVGLFTYQVAYHKKLGLSRPSLSVVALLSFAIYSTIIYEVKAPDGGPMGLIGLMQLWGAGGLLLWYVQSHQVRVRLQPIAWAFSIVVIQAIGFWLFTHFILSEPYINPSRTLIASFLDKGERYISGRSGGVSNYLVPYNLEHKGLFGLVRYTFFFPHPTITALVFSFIILIALDLKNRMWSQSLIVLCSLIIIILQSRNAWVVLPIVVLIRWVLLTGRVKGVAFLLALFAATSFITLSIPSVTSTLTDKITGTIESTSNLRKSSTDDRNKIYVRTWEAIIDEPPIIGNAVNGPSVTPGYDFARVGTESFVLGTLLYKSGFVGTGIFLTFLISFLSWIYKTRENRPACCFLMMLLLALMSSITEFTPTEVFTVLLCAMINNSS